MVVIFRITIVKNGFIFIEVWVMAAKRQIR